MTVVLIKWISSDNILKLLPNKNLSFCPGAVIYGAPQPFIVGPGLGNSPLCQSILLSIASPRVYHTALNSGSVSHKEFGLHTFPKFVLQTISAAPGMEWHCPFTLPMQFVSGDTQARQVYPKNLTIRFGPIVHVYTGEPPQPPQPRQHHSPRHVKTPFGKPELGISCQSMTTSKSWSQSSNITKHFWTVCKSIIPP